MDSKEKEEIQRAIIEAQKTLIDSDGFSNFEKRHKTKNYIVEVKVYKHYS